MPNDADNDVPYGTVYEIISPWSNRMVASYGKERGEGIWFYTGSKGGHITHYYNTWDACASDAHRNY